MSNLRFIFVSHSYKDADLYHRLIQELRKRPHFKFQDKSVPDLTLIQKENAKPDIRQRIKNCDVVLIFTRPIASKSPMIRFELDTAKKFAKPIIAIKPAGDTNVSKVVRQFATILIDWDLEEIVRQIRRPGSQPVSRIKPAIEVNDTANAEPEIITAPVEPTASRPGIKAVLLRAFGFSPRLLASAQSLPGSRILPEPQKSDEASRH